MENLIKNFLNKINFNKKIIISLDLDNTLIIRKKGANYINPKIKYYLKLLNNKITIIPNTGRDLIGFKSFSEKVFKFKNAVICNGSMLIIKNKIISNKNSFIANKIIKFFIKIVAENKLPFIDLTTNCGRTIIYNNVGDELKKLFFSQTPKAWLDKNLLTTCQVNKFNNLKEKIFRIEFPIFKNFNVLHIGDQDTGLINDTLIKKFIPQTFIIMVGNKCDLNNKDVDCYLPTNPEKSLFYFLKNLVFLFYH